MTSYGSKYDTGTCTRAHDIRMLMCSVQLRHLEMYMPQWCDYRELMLVSIALAILSYSTGTVYTVDISFIL